MQPRRILQGAGIAAVVLYPLYATALSPAGAFRMHSPTPLASFAAAMIANLVILTILFSLLGSRIARSRLSQWFRLTVPGILVASFAEVFYLHFHGAASIVLWVITFLAWSALQVALQACWRHGSRIVTTLSGVALAGLGVFSFLVLLQLIRLSLWQPAPNSLRTPVASRDSEMDRPRIVWILFDELSYDQVFEHRAQGLELPNFDALRQNSALFTNVQPVAQFTVLAVPSMLLGRAITEVQYRNDNRLLVSSAGQPTQPFNPNETAFATAQRAGLTTSVIGWYNPYCGMLAPYLNHCYWTNDALEPTVFHPGDGFWKNLTDTWVRYGIALHLFQDRRGLVRRIQVLQDLTQRSEKQLTQAEPDLVFIHLPVPHPPGVYDRTAKQFDTSGTRSYIDSLALADLTLGKLMAAMQSSPAWPRTNIVLCGDHSWRTRMWRALPGWTATDEAASGGGVFDQRPMLLVHLAGQTTAATVNKPTSLVQVHEILDSLIAGERPRFP